MSLAQVQMEMETEAKAMGRWMDVATSGAKIAILLFSSPSE
jgi:hypothetical protein